MASTKGNCLTPRSVPFLEVDFIRRPLCRVWGFSFLLRFGVSPKSQGCSGNPVGLVEASMGSLLRPASPAPNLPSYLRYWTMNISPISSLLVRLHLLLAEPSRCQVIFFSSSSWCCFWILLLHQGAAECCHPAPSRNQGGRWKTKLLRLDWIKLYFKAK